MKDWQITLGAIVLCLTLLGATLLNINKFTEEYPTKPTSIGSGRIVGSIREFRVEGKNYSFTPNELKVKKDEKIKIILINTDGYHDIKIDTFNVESKRIYKGNTDTIKFTANKSGSFDFYCTVHEHLVRGMKGKLIVE